MEDKELITNAYHTDFRAWNCQFSVDKISLKVQDKGTNTRR